MTVTCNELLEKGDHWLLLEPPGAGPLLHLLLAAALEVSLVAQSLQAGAPLGKLQGLGDLANVDAVEVDEAGTVPVDGGDVDDAFADPVDLPVVPPGPGVGTRPVSGLSQLQGQHLQGLHGEVEVEGAG